MQYYFVLGTNPTLSIAELAAIFGSQKPILINKNIFIINVLEKLNAHELINKLGGVIKIGEIITRVNNPAQACLLPAVIKILNPQKNKFKFGISFYGRESFNGRFLAMGIKKYWRDKKISSRWVTSKEKTLSSVVVGQNKLTGPGIEITLIDAENKILIGRTLAVQPYKELSKRDYGRPARDDRSGMLPPKLAQIMINLALSPSSLLPSPYACPERSRRKGEGPRVRLGSRDEVILDPFCGSGTILTEALLMGYKNIIGADISQKAIAGTNKNITWIKSQFPISRPGADQPRAGKFRVFIADARKISQHVEPKSIDAIITEPYLGPQRGRYDIDKTIKELERLYSASLAEFKKVLKPNGRVVMAWPVFHARPKLKKITPEVGGFKIINPLPPAWQKNPIIELTSRQTIIYGRPGQKVWREIVILKKALPIK